MSEWVSGDGRKPRKTSDLRDKKDCENGAKRLTMAGWCGMISTCKSEVYLLRRLPAESFGISSRNGTGLHG